MKTTVYVISIILIFYFLGLTALFFFQNHLLYPAPAGGKIEPKPGWEEIEISNGKNKLIAYHLSSHPDKPTLIFFHGNATGYEASIIATQAFADEGVNILIPEYPSYGGNPGKASEASIKQAGISAYNWLIAAGVRPDQIYVYGNSLGTAPAIEVAKRPNAGLIISSGLASMVDVVKYHYPIVPSALLNDKYENEKEISKVRSPVLIAHALDDNVVPYEHATRLRKASDGKLLTLKSGAHFIAFDRTVGSLLAREIKAGSSLSSIK